MTREREALKQEPNGYVQTVIEALYENGDPVSVDAAELLQRITAQPEQEPVACDCRLQADECNGDTATFHPFQVGASCSTRLCERVYTTPPKREWVGLTVEQIEDVGFNLLPTVAQKDFVEFARYVEMLSKEKNHD